jgi:hypothetical protein
MPNHGDTMQPSTGSGAHSPAAERMRRHRERRRKGLQCFRIELRETEIDALILKGFLKPETRNDRYAILTALYAFLDRKLSGGA